MYGLREKVCSLHVFGEESEQLFTLCLIQQFIFYCFIRIFARRAHFVIVNHKQILVIFNKFSLFCNFEGVHLLIKYLLIRHWQVPSNSQKFVILFPLVLTIFTMHASPLWWAVTQVRSLSIDTRSSILTNVGIKAFIKICKK